MRGALAACGLLALLVANYSDTCAPWDGAALAIDVPALGLRVRLYGDSIAQFETGEKVVAQKQPSAQGNTAEVWGKTAGVPYVHVAVEAKMDPKTGRGFVAVDGVKRPARFKKSGQAPARCG